jgi:hypothetical protein
MSPVTAAEIIVYHAANNPDADAVTVGGAIDPKRRAVFTKMAANDTVQAVSSSAGDTQNCTVTARAADGSVVSETKALTGVTPITFATLGTVQRILAVELASDAAGTVTIRRTTGAVLIQTIPATERGFSMVFRKGSSDAAGGATRNYYAKVFLKNTNGTLALTTAVVKQNADPDARITHLLAATKGDSATVANRQTAPSAADTLDPDTFDDTDKNVPTGSLGSGEAIGVWLRLQLPAGDAPHDTTYTLELAGQTV